MTVDRTVVFLDLSRFTSLTDVHGDIAAVEVVDAFIEAVQGSLPAGARLVKTLGDGVLVDAAGPASAVALADAVAHVLHERGGMPELTGGIAAGPVVDRDGDIFGATVNLAARLASLAPAGELRVTRGAALAAAQAGWQVEPLGEELVRGFHHPIEVYRVLLCHPADCVVDPVCGMRITPGPSTPTTADTAGGIVWFCGATCADRFAAAPDRYQSPELPR